MLEPIGQEALPELRRYLEAHYRDNVILLHDLSRGTSHDQLTLSGYALDGEVVSTQGRYASGRWFPHFVDDRAIEPLVLDARQTSLRWVMGIERVVSPLLERLVPAHIPLSYDERDHIYQVNTKTLRLAPSPQVRRAERKDIPAIAHLRRCFDAEYFGSDPRRISQSWCLRMASVYVQNGAAVAEHDGQVVAMVATEALIPQLAHIGGVYTLPPYRNQGLATRVVSTLCLHHLRHYPRVTLTVRKDNAPALCVYQALGFASWGDYRMARIK